MQQATQNKSSKKAIEHGNQIPICTPFPYEGKVRAKQIAPFLGIGVSTFWLYVSDGRIEKPMRYGARVSVWDAAYIRELATNGIPEVTTAKS